MLRQLGADLGFVPIVIGASVTIFVLTLLASGNELEIVGGGMNILSPSSRALLLFGMSGAMPVYRYGWWWTLFSASWLHGGLIHLAFNMMFMRQMGPATAEIIGPSRTVIVYVVSGVVGFFLSSTAGFLLGWVADSVSARRLLHDGRVRLGVRPARRARALREDQRQQPH